MLNILSTLHRFSQSFLTNKDEIRFHFALQGGQLSQLSQSPASTEPSCMIRIPSALSGKTASATILNEKQLVKQKALE
jgi:hypothetical protein